MKEKKGLEAGEMECPGKGVQGCSVQGTVYQAILVLLNSGLGFLVLGIAIQGGPRVRKSGDKGGER